MRRIHRRGRVVEDSFPNHPAKFPRVLVAHELRDSPCDRRTLILVAGDLQ